ncbi:MAG: trypsin-like peptidase domain-containing protein [Hydrogenibacillus schlegelii]|nr:trypsin-like peptidase domain-containing protein [Hydrogenibacillus schlegelii]
MAPELAHGAGRGLAMGEKTWERLFGGGRRSGGRWLIIAGAVAIALVAGFIGFRLAMLIQGGPSQPSASLPTAPLSTSEQIVQTVADIEGLVVGVTAYRHKKAGDDGSSGSAVVIARKKGMAYLLTNHHVVEGADRIDVTTGDGETVPAERVGVDPYTDLALLRIPQRYVDKVAVLGSSAKVRKGEMVIVAGNALGIYADTVNIGFISSLHQKLPIYFGDGAEPDWELDVLQVDAAMNYGNSGGGLFNLRGELIGINNAKVVEPGVENIGFAIPIDLAQAVAAELEQYGKVRRPDLGIVPVGLAYVAEDIYRSLKLPPTVHEGVLIRDMPEGPAKAAGLSAYDVIVALDDRPVYDKVSFRQTLFQHKIGDTVKVTYYHAGERKERLVTLGEAP